MLTWGMGRTESHDLTEKFECVGSVMMNARAILHTLSHPILTFLNPPKKNLNKQKKNSNEIQLPRVT